jgi:hypothetical protein
MVGAPAGAATGLTASQNAVFRVRSHPGPREWDKGLHEPVVRPGRLALAAMRGHGGEPRELGMWRQQSGSPRRPRNGGDYDERDLTAR